MTNKINIPVEKIPRPDQVAMAEAIGGAAIIGDSTEFINTNNKLFGFVAADRNAENKPDEYDIKHPIVTAGAPEASLIDILRSDGVDEILEADKHVEEPSLLLASSPIPKPEVTSKPDSDFVEMEIDGIMKRVPRN